MILLSLFTKGQSSNQHSGICRWLRRSEISMDADHFPHYFARDFSMSTNYLSLTLVSVSRDPGTLLAPSHVQEIGCRMETWFSLLKSSNLSLSSPRLLFCSNERLGCRSVMTPSFLQSAFGSRRKTFLVIQTPLSWILFESS